MKTVLIQVGHWNAEHITKTGLRSWRDVNTLKKSTGGSGERDFMWNKVMPLLRDKLIAAGVQVYITDATYRTDIYGRNYDLMVSLHDDGGGTDNRFMASAPLRGATPPYLSSDAQTKAEKFVEVWSRVYSQMTGASYQAGRVTAGMREYYGWDYVGTETPAVILEHFNRDNSKGQELRANPERVAEADFQAIAEFLQLKPAQPPQTNPTEIEKLKAERDRFENLYKAQIGITDKQAQEIDTLKARIENAKVAASNLVKALG